MIAEYNDDGVLVATFTADESPEVWCSRELIEQMIAQYNFCAINHGQGV